MTRETKFGLMLVLVLTSVFGFLVYKRANRPAELIAQTEPAGDDDDSSDDAPEAAGEQKPFGFDDDNHSEPPRMALSSSTKTIPADDEAEANDDLNDPFNTATDTLPARTASASPPRLPMTIPDEDAEEEFEPPASTPAVAGSNGPDLDENDPFNESAAETAATDSDPFSTAVESNPPPARTAAAPVAEEDAAEPFSLEAPAMTAESDAPELGFEDAGQDREVEAPATQPDNVVRTRAAALPTDEEDDLTTNDGAVSVQVRTKLPETALDFGEPEEPQPLQPETELDSREIAPSTAAPELMLDDSEEDRYGGYEPIELTSASAEAPLLTADTIEAVPQRAPAESTAFEAPMKAVRPTSTIAGDRYVIQSGDNFWSISQKKYGTGRYFQALAAYNKSRVPDPSRMKPGVEIALPEADDLETRYASLVPSQQAQEPAAGVANATGELLQGSNGQPMYRVGSGDTLSGIAQKYLGRSRRWEQILELNRDVLKDGNTLKMGMVLKLPSDAGNVQLSTQPKFFR